MDRDTLELWGGIALVAVGGLALFSFVLSGVGLTNLVYAVAVFALALGALLVGLSKRGRPV